MLPRVTRADLTCVGREDKRSAAPSQTAAREEEISCPRVTPLASFLLLILLDLGIPVPAQPAAADCDEWHTCRALALEARENGDFERFHDLAWRAVQKRGRRDPELMFLLARAQSLSGRPQDALVMLRRLAELGEPFDALTHEDLVRTRALPAWPEAQALLERAAAPPATLAPAAAAAAPGAAAVTSARAAAAAGTTPIAPAVSPASRTVARFPVPSFVPGGMAYDAVSRRFIVGNVPARKLTVVGEGTNRPATYAGAAAAFFDVRALQIDRRQGDLWVVSMGCDRQAVCRSALHKLQLISGRVLKVFDPPHETSRLLDVAVSGGRILVLDADGPRVLQAGAGNGTMETIVDLAKGEVSSLAPSADGRAVYVAYRDRLVRADVRTRKVARVGAGKADLTGLERIRWHRGALVAIQAGRASSSRRIVRIRLAGGGARVRAVDALSDMTDDGSRLLAMDIVDDELYYLVTPASERDEAVIRSVPLR